MADVKKIWDTMRAFIRNDYGTAGLMGNLKAESALEPVCLEKTYRTKLGMTSKAYTTAVDNGTYQNFATDGAGYGLAQWTYESHKAGLLAYAKYKGKSIGDLDLQLEYLQSDLNAFSSVLAVLRTASSVKEASDDVLLRYEKPANTSASVKKKRASYGQAFLDEYGDKQWIKDTEKACQVVASARGRIGDPYVYAALGEACTPANRRKYVRSDYPSIVDDCPVLSGKQSKCSGCKYDGDDIYDCRGFVYRCFLDVGITINGAGATSQFNDKSNWMMTGLTDDMPDVVCAVYKHKGDKMSHTGIYIGDGHIIHCSGNVKTGEITDRSWTHYAIPIGLYSKKFVQNARRIKAVAVLKKGSTGAAVKELQEKLTELGYDCGAIDGVYGTATVKAVKLFQTDHGLAVDGIAGLNTQVALDEAVNAKQDKPKDELWDFILEQVGIIKEKSEAIEDALKEVRYR